MNNLEALQTISSLINISIELYHIYNENIGYISLSDDDKELLEIGRRFASSIDRYTPTMLTLALKNDDTAPSTEFIAIMTEYRSLIGIGKRLISVINSKINNLALEVKI